jgi:hypothetical protein
MSIKRRFIISIIIIISVIGVIIYSSGKKNVTKDETVQTSPTPTTVSLALWTDPAGFSFQYPDGTKIDQHPEDSINYANLTLTLSAGDTLNIVMSDNTFKNLDTWAGQSSAIDTTIGGKTAKKIIKDGVTTIACIDNEVLVTITGKDTSTIANSWTFIYPTPTVSKNTKTNTSTTDSGDILEEE